MLLDVAYNVRMIGCLSLFISSFAPLHLVIYLPFLLAQCFHKLPPWQPAPLPSHGLYCATRPAPPVASGTNCTHASAASPALARWLPISSLAGPRWPSLALLFQSNGPILFLNFPCSLVSDFSAIDCGAWHHQSQDIRARLGSDSHNHWISSDGSPCFRHGFARLAHTLPGRQR